ncbi:MAG: MerR family transcriptional regulator [Clostridia bacterium]|nr:MerR family transcriptional regulator [Clostridia bacterium]
MTIAEVSKQFDISADTLRYYERIGLIPPVPRTAGGIRDYDEASCKWIELMKHLRAAGVQIEALVEYTALVQQGDQTQAQRKNLLLEQREQLERRIAEMQQSLERLNKRLEWYDRCEGCTISHIRKLEQQRKG